MTIIEKIMGHLGRYQDAADTIKGWLTGKAGVEVAEGTLIDEMADMVAAVEPGGGAGSSDDFEITDASYLFYKGARTAIMDQLLRKIKGNKSFENTFCGCSNLKDVDLSAIDFSATTSLESAFKDSGVTAVSFGKQACAKDISFKDCFMRSFIKSLDFTEFVARADRFDSMCAYCYDLESFDFGGLVPNSASYANSMFAGCRSIEEILNYGVGGAIGQNTSFPCGSSGKQFALKRITFSKAFDNESYFAIRSAIKISYCSMERARFLEMIDTITDVSALGLTTAQSTITLTGNPCVTGLLPDGSTACETITDEDRAIATAKGWTIVE